MTISPLDWWSFFIRCCLQIN